MSETAACHPIPLADHPSTLPSPTSSPPPVSDSCLFTRCQPLYASRYTVLLYFSRYCMIRLKMFSLFFCVCLLFTYYLCEKYYKAVTVQHYIAGCVIWLPRLTLQDLRMNGTYQRTVRMELVCMPGTYSISRWCFVHFLCCPQGQAEGMYCRCFIRKCLWNRFISYTLLSGNDHLFCAPNSTENLWTHKNAQIRTALISIIKSGLLGDSNQHTAIITSQHSESTFKSTSSFTNLIPLHLYLYPVGDND